MGELLSPEAARRDVGQCWGDAEGQEHGAASRAPQKYSALGAPPPLLAIHLLQSPHPGVGTSQGCAKAACRGHGGRVGTGQRGGSILPSSSSSFFFSSFSQVQGKEQKLGDLGTVGQGPGAQDRTTGTVPGPPLVAGDEAKRGGYGSEAAGEAGASSGSHMCRGC